MNNDTVLFNVSDLRSAEIKMTLEEVMDTLETAGYDPINQVVGYIISGDPGYITSREEARNKLTRIDRAELVAAILKGYVK